MQSAAVKAILKPVHNALYDHLTAFGWCVRGDVTKADFMAVWDDRGDEEDIISGDYSAATDNISLEAVEAIVSVIMESEQLTREERETLKASFTDITVRFSRMNEKNVFVVNRGSMMGNLVSFPLLCLINKACFDWTCDLRGVARRVGRFNGDDCLFPGDKCFYDQWRQVTGAFGLIVNEEKTGFSRRYGELNSRVFDYKHFRLIGKPVLSFLRPVEASQPGCVLGDILDGIRCLKSSVQSWIVMDLMRYEICRRKICVATIPSRWLATLLRRRWFRDACVKDPPSTKTWGISRSVPTILGPPPRPEFYEEVERCTVRLNLAYRDLLRGQALVPAWVRLDRTQPPQPPPPKTPWFYVVEYRWMWLWPRPLLDWVERTRPGVLSTDNDIWVDDHPLLHRVGELKPRGSRRGHHEPCPFRPADVLLAGSRFRLEDLTYTWRC
jgi:hypothetical protein